MYTKKRPATKAYKGPALKRTYSQRYTAPTRYTPRMTSAGEWKYLDTAATYAVDSTGSLALLNGLTPGTGATERIGQKITIRSLEYRGYNYVTPTDGTDQLQRIILVLDRQANASALTIAGVLQSANVYSPRNLQNRKRFKILYDKTFNLNASAEAGSRRFTKFYMKLRRPIITDYNTGNAGTVADIVTNSLYLINLGTNPAGATAGGSISWIRMRYTDQ